MKKLLLALLMASLAGTAFADRDDDDDDDHPRSMGRRTMGDYARVVAVSPQYDQISRPRERCTTETVYDQRVIEGSRDYTGTIVGGAIGGALGNRVGKGNGRTVATVAGAVIGSVIGDQVAGQHRQPARVEQVPRETRRCYTEERYERQLRGYQVEYEYRGRRYSDFMTRNPGRPGSRLPVRLIVQLDD